MRGESFVSPLRGCVVLGRRVPSANALGYVISPLRGFLSANLEVMMSLCGNAISSFSR